ncbi:MAG TPA: hypothetical protein VE986_01270 [Hyphomicrobiales bacterium]|nr:hypothetical protein [Hyphomicrobiales bacterium]
MPDAGPVVLTRFSTVEARRPANATSAAAPLAKPNGQPSEPETLPAAQALEKFYIALSALSSAKRSQPVTILHLGDDRIVNDRFAGSLREQLISRFGSAGRSLMAPGLFSLRGIKVERGGQWTLASAAADSAGPFGITGVRVSSSASDAWLRFTSAQGPFDWFEVTFMTGPGRGSARVSFDGEVRLVPTATLAVNQSSVRIAAKAREIMIRPNGDGEISVLSVAAGTNTPGIAYANLGLPGAAAWTPAKWDDGFASRDIGKLRPDLVILTYGTREAFTDELDVRKYESQLSSLVERIRVWAPQASILIVGPPDAARLPAFSSSAGAQACRALNPQEIAAYSRLMERGDERLARWHAPPGLESVRSALRRAAAASGSFYWDWAGYMGGPCSIHAWASLKPPLAAADHVTLTEAGEQRSARALFAELMTGFDAYQRSMQSKAQTMVSVEGSQQRPNKKGRKKEPKS